MWMKMDKWIIDYLNLYYSGHYNDAETIKNCHIPQKLYKFEPFEKQRIETLVNRKIYVSHATSFDNPYDTKGFFIQKDKIMKEYNEFNKKDEFSLSAEEYYEEIIKKSKFWFEKCWISCFTEELYNFPMWYYYADKYKGYCVEYDFSVLKNTDEFKQSIKPVIYLSRKYDMTNIYKCVFNPGKILNGESSTYYLLHTLGNTLKHESWKFQKEWRYISFDDDFKLSGKTIDNLVTPTAIICGNKMNEKNYDQMKKIAIHYGCPIRKVEIYEEQEEKFII